jgi:hypothetical protein
MKYLRGVITVKKLFFSCLSVRSCKFFALRIIEPLDMMVQ